MKLLDQVAAACRGRYLAPATRAVYGFWVEDYLRFHRREAGRWVHPRELREAGVERYLTHLAVDRDLSASSQNQAVCALVFLYRDVLKEPLGEFSAVRAKRPQRLPTVLSVDEVRRVLTALGRHPTFGLMGQLLYGGGLRVSECCELATPFPPRARALVLDPRRDRGQAPDRPFRRVPVVRPLHGFQVAPQRPEGDGRQRHRPVLSPFAVADPDLPPIEVEVHDPQFAALAHPQAAAVE